MDDDLPMEEAQRLINSDPWWHGTIHNGVLYADAANCNGIEIRATEGLTYDKLVELLNTVASFDPTRTKGQAWNGPTFPKRCACCGMLNCACKITEKHFSAHCETHQRHEYFDYGWEDDGPPDNVKLRDFY